MKTTPSRRFVFQEYFSLYAGLFWTAQGDPEISPLRLRFSTRQSISRFTPLYDKSTKTQGSSFTPVRSLKIGAIILAGQMQTPQRTERILPLCRFLLAVSDMNQKRYLCKCQFWYWDIWIKTFLKLIHMKPCMCVPLFQPTALPQQNFSMHVAVPVTNPNAMSYNPGASLSSQSLSAAAASLSDGAMLSPPQGSLHRNVVSTGPPQRPPSTGSAGWCCSLHVLEFLPSKVGQFQYHHVLEFFLTACMSRDVFFGIISLLSKFDTDVVFLCLWLWDLLEEVVMFFPSCCAQTSIRCLTCFVFHTFSALAWEKRKWDQLVVSWKWSPWRQQALMPSDLLFKLVWQQWALWLGHTSPGVKCERQTDWQIENKRLHLDVLREDFPWQQMKI